MKTMGIMIKKESSDGTSVTLSRFGTMMKEKGFTYLYIVHFHWTAFGRFDNDDYYSYESAKDAIKMFKIYDQKNAKTYINM